MRFLVFMLLLSSSIVAHGHDLFDIEELMSDAKNAAFSGQTEVAIALYREVLAHDPQNNNAMLGIAIEYQKAHQYDDACKIYKELLSLKPRNYKILKGYLNAISHSEPEYALSELRYLEEIYPEDPQIRAHIGMVHVSLMNYRQAEKYLKTALSLDPDNVVYRYNLAVLCDKLGKYREASHLYTQILKSDNSHTLAASYESIKDRLDYLHSILQR